MNEMNWFDALPSIMSTVATIAAAIAAIGSLHVSREAKLIAEQSALAMHHGSAAMALTNAVDKLMKSTETFSELAYCTWAKWPSEIEALDHRQAGGSNPRPLRHVLTDASEMLVKHSIKQEKRYRYTKRPMYSLVLDGVNNLNDREYEDLLRLADGKYCDFEGVFGEPSIRKEIVTAPAFRWAFHQLTRRIDEETWYGIWEKAWLENGWINKFRSEHSKIKPTLESILSSLKSERDKLGHTVFPLESNPSLCLKYDDLLDVVEVLLDNCSLDLVEPYSGRPHKDDLIPLVVYSMGIAFLVTKALDSVHGTLIRH